MKKLAIVTVVAALFAGCTSVEITREGSYNDAQLKMKASAETNASWIFGTCGKKKKPVERFRADASAPSSSEMRRESTGCQSIPRMESGAV